MNDILTSTSAPNFTTYLTAITAGISFGIASSLHCFGMCGGLLTMLQRAEQSQKEDLVNVTLYLSFRWFSYTALGALSGLIGAQFIQLFRDHNLFQGWTWLILTSILGVGVLFSLSKLHLPFGQGIFRSLFQKINRLSMHKRAMYLGLINPLLPCGVVIGGMILAAGSGDGIGGALFFGSFAFISSPSLFIASMFFQSMKQKLSTQQFQILQVSFLIVTTLILFYRANLLLQAQACH